MGITLINVHLHWLNWFHFVILLTSYYSDRLHDFTVIIPRCYKDVYINSFFPCKARIWNSLPAESFPLNYYLNGFKDRVKRHFFFGLFLNCLHPSSISNLFHPFQWVFSLAWSDKTQLKKAILYKKWTGFRSIFLAKE